MICRPLLIRGRVQGVSFRDWTVATARSLGLDGWVRNRRDGSVETLVAGEPEAVAAFVTRCRQGPPGARVDALDDEEAPAVPPRGFVKRETV